MFPVIFIGELPDKTMFAGLVMAPHGRARSVWVGAAAAFVVHVVIATTIGVALFKVVPHRVLRRWSPPCPWSAPSSRGSKRSKTWNS